METQVAATMEHNCNSGPEAEAYIGLLALNEFGAVQAVDSGALRVLDCPEHEVLGNRLSALTDICLSQISNDDSDSYARSHGNLPAGACILQRATGNGKTLPVELHVTDIALDGRPQAFAVVRSLLREDYSEPARQHSQRMESVGVLAAGIAHEINTPLQFVIDNIEYLSERADNLFALIEHFQDSLAPTAPDVSREERYRVASQLLDKCKFGHLKDEMLDAVEECQEGVKRIADLIKVLNGFSHPGGGAKEKTDLNRVVRDAAKLATGRWKRVADVDFQLDAGVSPVWAYQGQLCQVLLNLIVNAADAIAERSDDDSDPVGKIVLRTRSEGNWTVVEVQDNGIGMSEETQRQAFTPFFTTKAPGQGTGQGLSICYDTVVVKHGGELHVTSKPGHGTTFLVRLPSGNADNLADGTTTHSDEHQ